MTEYENLFFEYIPENNWYVIFDTLLGAGIGFVLLHEGPGWVFSAYESTYMQDELQSVVNLLDDLNSVLEE